MKRKHILPIIALLFIQFCFAQNGTFNTFSQICKDGKERPFIIYSPKDIIDKKNQPILIYLHGSISSKNIKNNPLNYIKKSKLIHIAEQFGFHLMFSYGQNKATWFDEVGTDMVLKEIEQAKRKLHIDPNKIFLSGFSDGGTGVFYFSMVYPEQFAGFIAMNGSLKIADKLGTHKMYPENMNHKKMLVINTKKDMLYPIHQMTASVEYLKKFNPNIEYLALDGNHEMSYLKDNPNLIGDFIQKNTRTPYQTISLEVASENAPNIDWLSIKKLNKNAKRKNFHQKYTYKILNDKAFIGLKYDYNYKGKGLRVKLFKERHPTAKNLGIKIGDTITQFGTKKVTSPYTPFMYKASKKAGENLSITVLRNGKEKTIHGTFAKGYEYDLFSHPKNSGKIEARIENKKLIINTSKIGSFNIDFNKIKQRIKHIIINGKKKKIPKESNNKIISFEV